ncbi:hypothetical protein N9N67_08035 [Bacteriovoracaceae bacterium]|nr:hypothetical protein [Bacteriovoracaceae bacterium]
MLQSRMMRWVLFFTLILINQNSLAKTCRDELLGKFYQIGLQQNKSKIMAKKYFNSKEYRQTGFNFYASNNHFQSIIKIPHSEVVYITGSNKKNMSGDLIIVDHEKKKLVKKFKISKNDFWHPGGMGILDQTMSIPLESKDNPAKIVFYNVSDPFNPQIDSKPFDTKFKDAMATTMFRAKIDNELIPILLVKGHNEYYFYRAQTNDLNDGFSPQVYGLVHERDILSKYKKKYFYHGQNVSYLKSCGEYHYFIEGLTSVLNYFKNSIQLIELNWKSLETKLVARKKLKCGGYCHFRAGSGAIFEDDKIKFIGVPFHRKGKGMLKYKIFYLE